MIELVTAVATEPVTLAEAKLHLRVDDTTRDSQIAILIVAARKRAEHLTGRALGEQTLKYRLSNFGCDGIVLEKPPANGLPTVSWVKYKDTSNTEQTLSTSVYYLDGATVEPVIRLAYGQVWPILYQQQNVVSVQYVTGAGGCPEDVKYWMLLDIEAQFENKARQPWEDRLLDSVAIKRA